MRRVYKLGTIVRMTWSAVFRRVTVLAVMLGACSSDGPTSWLCPRSWIPQPTRNGLRVLVARERRKFTPEFKGEVVELCLRGDRSIGQVSRDLGLTETAVREWARQAKVDAGCGPDGALTTSEREELRRLRRENRQLRDDREMLEMAVRRRQPARGLIHHSVAESSFGTLESELIDRKP